MIIFKENKLTETSSFDKQIIIQIDKITFNTKDSNWVERLFTASLKFTETYYNCQKKEIGSSSFQVTLGQFITTKHKQPVFDTNLIVEFNEFQSMNKNEKVCFWKMNITVKNLTFKNDETMTIYTQSSHKI